MTKLWLKWGTFKWVEDPTPEMVEILDRYYAMGSCTSAALQCDTDAQRDLVHALVDACPGEIINGYDNERYTKERAHEYLREWRARDAAKREAKRRQAEEAGAADLSAYDGIQPRLLSEPQAYKRACIRMGAVDALNAVAALAESGASPDAIARFARDTVQSLSGSPV